MSVPMKELQINGFSDAAVIVVCREDDRILYCNEAAKSLAPEAEVGKPYGSFLGKDAGTHAASIEWGAEKIPAYVVTFVPGREGAMKDRQMVMDMTMDALLGKAFDEIVYMNLTRDKIVMVRESGMYEAAGEQSRKGFEEEFLRTLHPDDRDGFMRHFGRENLIREFSGEDAGPVYREGRRRGKDGQYHWISMQALPMTEDESGDRMTVFLLSTIDKRKTLEQETRMMTNSMVSLFGELLLVDMKTGKFIARKSDEAMNSLEEQEDFAQFNRMYGERLVHPDNREKFFEMFTIPNMRKQIEEGKRQLNMELRRRNSDGEYRWCELIGIVMDNDLSGDYKVFLTFRDIDELRKAQREKKNADTRFVAAVNSFYDTIYEAELNSGYFRFWKQTDDILYDKGASVSLEKHVEWCINTKIHPDYKAAYKEKLDIPSIKKAFERGEKKELSLEVPELCADGMYRWFSVQVQLLYRDEDEIRIMVYVKNIDDARKEEERKNEELREALNLANQASVAKSEFLSRMSHDIRSPMNAILGMTSIAAENLEKPDKIADCLEKIGVSAKFLLTLINDVLDMSRIENGKMELVLKPFDLNELLEQLTVICEEQSKRKQQEFIVEVSPEVGRRYMGDSLRIQQVLMNLLGNSMKYTKERGHISLCIDSVQAEAGQEKLVFCVKDDGIGMSEEFRERLFEPFEQEHLEGGRVFEGSGLGLSITQNLVGLMNGQISVESEKNKGSCFIVTVPLKRMEEEAGGMPVQKNRPEPEDKVDFSGKRVLLVEDNELNMEIAKSLLEMKNLLVESAWNGAEAVSVFEHAEPGYFHAVLMDIRMPVMNGLEAASRIRGLDRADAQTIPIIAMTANAFWQEAKKAQEAGINGYLTKPVEPEVLYRTLEKALSGKRLIQP
ncbi:ATP-binding protein [Lacrimispora sp. NSJ-141]|uniref:Circadian input-output histidine kinase CikA n=1 Tax=Lientehia hominis TaxID=2897778 RepID=A0AAP2WAM8_9FIRM|nr:ATP-binding protein [Lientehia hominis]MCD2493617.1 ATP-binding protein [Lientehia hominis]